MTDQELKAKKEELKKLRADKEKLLIEAKIEKAKKEIEILKMTPEEREAEVERLLNEEEEKEGGKKQGFFNKLERLDKKMNSPMGDEYNWLKWLAIGFLVFVVVLLLADGM